MAILLQDLCEGATYYADLIHQKLKAAGYYDDIGQFDVTEQVHNLSKYDQDQSNTNKSYSLQNNTQKCNITCFSSFVSPSMILNKYVEHCDHCLMPCKSQRF